MKIQRFDRMITLCQTLNAMANRLTKLEADINQIPPLPADTRRRRYTALQLAQEQLDAQMHNLHCEAVLAGVADLNPERYGVLPLVTAFGQVMVLHRHPLEHEEALPTPLEQVLLETQSTRSTDVVTTPSELVKEFNESDPDLAALVKYEEKPDDLDSDPTPMITEADLQELSIRVEGDGPSLSKWAKKLEGKETHTMDLSAMGDQGVSDSQIDALDKKIQAKAKARGNDLPDENLTPDLPDADLSGADNTPAKPMTLAQANKAYLATGVVPEGFTEVSGHLYKKAVDKSDPNRHIPAANVIQANQEKASIKTKAAKAEKPAKEAKAKPEPPPPVVLGEDMGKLTLNDDLVW